MLLTITDNVIRSQTGFSFFLFSFFLFLTIIFNKCHSYRNLSPSTRTSSRFISMHMEIFRYILAMLYYNFDPSKKLFIFKKKKKRIDTIFINFHLSIVVLLSRCNKYIYIQRNGVIHDRDRFSMRSEISSDTRAIFYFTRYLLG